MEIKNHRRFLWPILLVFFTLFLFGCPNGPSVPRMTGTITYLNNYSKDLTGKTFEIVVDVDDTEIDDNGNEIAKYPFTWQSGTTQDYVIDISALPSGTYYLRVYMEFVDGPATWRVYGYYGGEVIQEGHYPRLQLTIDGSCNVDFIIDAT